MIIIETCPKCGHDLNSIVIATNPPIPQKRCPSCGWFWEGEPEQVIHVPFRTEPIINPINTMVTGKESNYICQSNHNLNVVV